MAERIKPQRLISRFGPAVAVGLSTLFAPSVANAATCVGEIPLTVRNGVDVNGNRKWDDGIDKEGALINGATAVFDVVGGQRVDAGVTGANGQISKPARLTGECQTLDDGRQGVKFVVRVTAPAPDTRHDDTSLSIANNTGRPYTTHLFEQAVNPQATVKPTDTVRPTETAKPAATNTVVPTETAKPAATNTVVPTETAKPAATATVATLTPLPSITPGPTATLRVSQQALATKIALDGEINEQNNANKLTKENDKKVLLLSWLQTNPPGNTISNLGDAAKYVADFPASVVDNILPTDDGLRILIDAVGLAGAALILIALANRFPDMAQGAQAGLAWIRRIGRPAPPVAPVVPARVPRARRAPAVPVIAPALVAAAPVVPVVAAPAAPVVIPPVVAAPPIVPAASVARPPRRRIFGIPLP